jgi:hypothetical protein
MVMQRLLDSGSLLGLMTADEAGLSLTGLFHEEVGTARCEVLEGSRG